MCIAESISLKKQNAYGIDTHIQYIPKANLLLQAQNKHYT